MSKTRLQHKWEQVQADLGLDIIAPFRLELGDHVIHAELLVKSFGSQNGMLIVNNYRCVKDHLEQLQKLGFGFSVQDEHATRPRHRPLLRQRPILRLRHGSVHQPGPSGFAGGNTNLNAYVNNDPVNLIDPSGLSPKGNSGGRPGSPGSKPGQSRRKAAERAKPEWLESRRLPVLG